MTKQKDPQGARGKAKVSPAVRLPGPLPPLFRRIDWLTSLLTFVAMWVVYYLTLAPEVTLEDSGELVTGSFYAGVPHPPGYPVWTIYSWLWTVLVPVGSIAWRVALAQANAGAVACALIALMVSRGSSLFIESIESLKKMTGKWENGICVVSGFVAGVMMGLDGFMWRESVAVNRMAVSSVPWFMLVLVFLLRWLYAPHQYRFLYWALFLFGICFTTHQSLIVAAMGVEVLIAIGNPRLGRDAFLGNSLVYVVYNFARLVTGEHLFHNLGAKPGLLLIFNLIGMGSMIACGWLAVRTRGLFSEWKPVLFMGLLWLLGAAFYFYLPITCMTNPPMEWCYPRTVEGFFQALTRGQYEQPNPVNVITEGGRFIGQLGMLFGGVGESFTWVCVFIALVPFAFLLRMQRRERAWLVGLAATYLCVGVLLMILLNPAPERASADLVKVFFNSSHTLVAALIGYGLALTAAYMATHYEQFRRWGLAGGIVAVVLALYGLLEATGKHYFGPAGQIGLFELPRWIGRAFAPGQYGLPIYANLLLVSLALVFVGALVIYRRRAPLAITLGLFAAIPLHSGLSHWFECSQRGHMYGYWFGHDMFKPPFKGADGKLLFPEMSKDAILFGGTDPGRFCPTYMIFCESFTPHKCQPAEDQNFDRRDVYIITQNALADQNYLNYIRAQYNRSAQIDPPFFSELCRAVLKDKDYDTNLLAKLVRPLDSFCASIGERVEKRRHTFTSWFKDRDFVRVPDFVAKLRPHAEQDPLSKYLYENLSAPTQRLVCAVGNEKLLPRKLARELNRLLEDSVYENARFQHVALSEYLADFIRENPQGHLRIRLNRLLLEAAYPNEIGRSLGGVYPDREIRTPAPDDLQRCFEEYTQDAHRRMQLNQLKPGEDVKIIGNRIQVSGQVAIMGINGMITKTIFEQNPKRDFFVEESYPLDWMYPHLSPHGIIMKINRQPLASLPEDLLERDHEFWKQYSTRLTGDIIDYGTPVKEITQWIERTYERRNFNGFKGDRRFVHDIDAQKAFSKLRSAIAGMYVWRLSPQCPMEYRPKSDTEYRRLFKEAEFASLQAFAFSPWNPEAVFRCVNLLLQSNRLEDALLVTETCLKLDPYNEQMIGLRNNLQNFKQQQRGLEQSKENVRRLEEEVGKHPTNMQASFDLAGLYVQMQQTDRAVQFLDTVLEQPQLEVSSVLSVAKAFAQIGNWPRVESALEKLVRLLPGSPEAWYDLAAVKASVSKPDEALPALTRALELSTQRFRADPKARDLIAQARADPRFNALRDYTNFQLLVR